MASLAVYRKSSPTSTDHDVGDRNFGFCHTFSGHIHILGLQNLPISRCLLWSLSIKTTIELLERLRPIKYAWRQTPFDFIDTINAPSFTSEVLLKAKYWPKQKTFVGPSTRVHNDVFGLQYSKLDHVIMFAIWAGYAGVHISAWNFAFPSHAELILWRVASLTMTGSMFVSWFISNQNSYLLVAYFWPEERMELEKISAERAKATTSQMMLYTIIGFAYLAARISLIGAAPDFSIYYRCF